MDKVSMSHLISFSRYQIKCVKFLFILKSTSKAMADKGKKREGRKYENLNMSRTRRAF